MLRVQHRAVATHPARIQPHRGAALGRAVLAVSAAGLFFAAAADCLGVVLHLIGVMPLLP